MKIDLTKKDEDLSKALKQFKKEYPHIDSGYMQTFIIGWQAKVKNLAIHDVTNWVAVIDRLPDHIQKVIFYGKLESWSESETFTGVLNRAGGLNEWNTGGTIMHEVTHWRTDLEPPC